jgi:hypothetical protein
LIAGGPTKEDATRADLKGDPKATAAPGIAETEAIAEEGFVYGLPLVMNYAVMHEFAPLLDALDGSARRADGDFGPGGGTEPLLLSPVDRRQYV